MAEIITEEQYRKLKASVDEAKSETERAKGALEQMMKRLKEEYGCDDLSEAKRTLAKLKSRKEDAETAFQKAFSEYEEKWKA